MEAVKGRIGMLIVKFGGQNIEDEIAQTEARYSIVFPQQYRDFLLRYNGGFTPRTKFRAKGVSSDLRGFYGFGPVGLPVQQEQIDRWLPRDLFPIACDSFGNHILLSVAGDTYGALFFGDHEAGMAVTQVAKDLPAFLRLCKSDPIPEGARRSIEERRAALIARGRGHVITPALIELWQKEIDKYADMIQEEIT